MRVRAGLYSLFTSKFVNFYLEKDWPVSDITDVKAWQVCEKFKMFLYLSGRCFAWISCRILSFWSLFELSRWDCVHAAHCTKQCYLVLQEKVIVNFVLLCRKITCIPKIGEVLSFVFHEKWPSWRLDRLACIQKDEFSVRCFASSKLNILQKHGFLRRREVCGMMPFKAFGRDVF